MGTIGTIGGLTVITIGLDADVASCIVALVIKPSVAMLAVLIFPVGGFAFACAEGEQPAITKPTKTKVKKYLIFHL